MIFLFIGKC